MPAGPAGIGAASCFSGISLQVRPGGLYPSTLSLPNPKDRFDHRRRRATLPSVARAALYGCVCQVVEKSFVIRHGDYAAGVARASSWYPTNARRVMAPERSNPKSSSKTAS